MDDIDLTFIDEDFEFNKIDIKNPLLDLDDNNEIEKTDEDSTEKVQSKEKKIDNLESKKEEKKEFSKKESKKKNKETTKKNEINKRNENNDDLLSDIYDTLEGYSKLREKLNETTKKLELLKLDYEKLKDEEEYLNKKYKNENEAKIKLEFELKRTKTNLIEREKKVLMLKTLIQLIIRKYGEEEIANITGLNKEQLKNFLN